MQGLAGIVKVTSYLENANYSLVHSVRRSAGLGRFGVVPGASFIQHVLDHASHAACGYEFGDRMRVDRGWAAAVSTSTMAPSLAPAAPIEAFIDYQTAPQGA